MENDFLCEWQKIINQSWTRSEYEMMVIAVQNNDFSEQAE